MAQAVSKDLQDKVAIVTGAARNMGRAFAVALAARGADVVVHYHSASSHADAEETARQVQAEGVRALLAQGDLADGDTVSQVFHETMQAFGGVDIIINNAGQVIKKSMAEYSEADFDSSFAVNAKAPFLVMREAAHHLRDDGRVINMGTSLLAAFTGSYGVYAASKAPLEHFTRAMAKETGARGITVNTVAPGPVDTPFFRGQETSEAVAYLSAASVRGRLGAIDDVVPMINFLTSEEARWVTGQTLFVNGGFVTR